MKKFQILFILFGIIGCSSTSQVDDASYISKTQNNFKNNCIEDSTSFKTYPEFKINSFDGIFNEISTRNRPVKDDWETDIDFENRLNLFLDQKEDKIIKKLEMNIDFPCRNDNMHNEVCYDVNSSSIQIIFKNVFNYERVFEIDSESEYSNKYRMLMIERVEDRLKFNNLINRVIVIPFSSDKMRLNFDDYSFYILFEVDMLKDHDNSYQLDIDWKGSIAKNTEYRTLEVDFAGFSLEREEEIIIQSMCS
jgi:hypothetical protein